MLHISNTHGLSSCEFPVDAIRNPIKDHQLTISNISDLKHWPDSKKLQAINSFHNPALGLVVTLCALQLTTQVSIAHHPWRERNVIHSLILSLALVFCILLKLFLLK